MTEEQQKTLEGLQTAIKMEIDGKEFYLKASESSRNELGKKLLSKLASEEDQHRHNFENIYNAIRQQQDWPETGFKSDGGQQLRTIFSRALEAMDRDITALDTEMEAIQTAMTMENRTQDFYRERSRNAAYAAEQKLYNALAMQEEEHHRVLLDYYEFLKDPAAWFVQKEHPSLDGG